MYFNSNLVYKNASRYLHSVKEVFSKTDETQVLQSHPKGDPFRRFSIRVWQNAPANTVRRVMVCDVYFPFTKIL